MEISYNKLIFIDIKIYWNTGCVIFIHLGSDFWEKCEKNLHLAIPGVIFRNK